MSQKSLRTPSFGGSPGGAESSRRDAAGPRAGSVTSYGNANAGDVVEERTSTSTGTGAESPVQAPAAAPPVSSVPPAPPAAGEEEAQIPPGFDATQKAAQLHDALGGWGTDERAVFDALYTGRPDLVRAIEAEYNARFRPSLAETLGRELSGDDLVKAQKLLENGKLSLGDKIREGASGWGTDEQRIFNAFERATPEEIAEVRGDAELMGILQGELSGDDWQLAQAYLEGSDQVAARLRRAVGGMGTDEEEIWRTLGSASAEEKAFVMSQPELVAQLKGDLSEADWTKAKAMLEGTFDNADRVTAAMAGWGTDEEGLTSAIAGLSADEYARLPADIDARLKGELSGRDLALARDALHQRRLELDPDYREAYMKRQESAMGADALHHDGASALVAQEGQAQSAVARLKTATVGMGTDDKTVWSVLATLSPAEREFVAKYNPDGVLDALRKDLSDSDYARVMESLSGAKGGAMAALKQATEGWGTDEKLIYDAVDRAVTDGVTTELLGDPALMEALQKDLSKDQLAILREAMQTGSFTDRQRLAWATSGAGTDEELVLALCARNGSQWWDGTQVAPDVDAILKAELSTTDYWAALDRIRGEPKTEQERLERSKEQLERERGSPVSAGIMDLLSSKGENADDAWREYQASYNVAYTDGEITDQEVATLRRDEAFSERMTGEYKQTKAAAAQWATQIAVGITGIAATVLTAGAAGPLVAGIAAAMGGKVAVAAEMMLLAAAAKVGLNRAIQGEGYDVTSADALIDAASAALEVGLNLVGSQVTQAAMEGLGKSALVARASGAVEKVFGGAGKRILGAGLDGAIDGSIGGFGEGVFTAASDERTWKGDAEAVAGRFGGMVFQRTAMSAASGFMSQAAFQSLGEVYGAATRSRLQGGEDPALHDTPGDGEDLTVRKTQEDPLPGLRDKHSTYGYEDQVNGKAFVKGEGDALDIDPNDVKQGALGDCYLMAGMAATARANPENIRRIIKDNGDGTFEVTMFIRENAWSAPKAVTRTVDARLPTKGGSSLLYAGVGDSVDGSDELWPSLLEKTLAQHKESYDLISGGNISKEFEFHGATELFTGKKELYYTASSLSEDKTLAMMQTALANSKPITVDSMNMENLPDLTKDANAVNVYGNHAYAVQSVDVAKKTVTLQNPWGSHHVVELPIKDFKRFYRAVRVGGN